MNLPLHLRKYDKHNVKYLAWLEKQYQKYPFYYWYSIKIFLMKHWGITQNYSVKNYNNSYIIVCKCNLFGLEK